MVDAAGQTVTVTAVSSNTALIPHPTVGAVTAGINVRYRRTEIGKQLSTLADAYDVKLPRELVLIGKQFLYVERYMKLLAPKWQMMSDPQLTGYFANFMVEVSREHSEEVDV